MPVRLTATLLVLIAAGCSRSGPEGAYVPRARGTLTFNRDIAPIVFRNCSVCHRPGEAAPFSLLTYQDVQKRAKQIAAVTGRRYMPPWPPRSGHGEFAGSRALTEDQIGVIRQWMEEGAVEGAAADLPAPPAWKDGWQLGTPDLVLELPEPFEVPADGPDIYRNFVFQAPLRQGAFVRALEVNPDNRRVAHHALVLLDPTRSSRRMDEASPGPGFGGTDGMKVPDSVVPPAGFFNSWNPGKVPFAGYDDMAWPLEPGTDLVLQMHLQPSGKVERVKPSLGIYLARTRPTRFPIVLCLRSLLIDIPAGEKSYSFETKYTLPVDVDVLGVLPHLHYIGKQVQGLATLPGGKTEWLIDIPDWDFNWQGDYRFARPVSLPRGAQITQRYTYDNSADNPRNRSSPPAPVRYGPRSADEMGELWIQVLPRDARDAAALESDFYRWRLENENVRDALGIIEKDPGNWASLLDLAKARSLQGRTADALECAERAIRAAPEEAEPHRLFGYLKMQDGPGQDLRMAAFHLGTAVRLRPEHFEAYNDLGLVWKMSGDVARAAACFERAREIAPDYPAAVYNLGTIAFERGDAAGAIRLFEKTLEIDPSYRLARVAIAKIRPR